MNSPQRQSDTPPPLPSQRHISSPLPSQPPPLPQQPSLPASTYSPLPQKNDSYKLIAFLSLIVVACLSLLASHFSGERTKQADFAYVDRAIEVQRPVINEAKRLYSLSPYSPNSIQNLIAAVEKQQQAVNALERINPQSSEGETLRDETLSVENENLRFYQQGLNAATEALRGEPLRY